MKTRRKIIFVALAFATFLAAFFCAPAAKAFEDNTAPEILSLTFSPTEFDTSEQDQTVTATMEVSDEGVGICVSSEPTCSGGYPENQSSLGVLLVPQIGTSTQRKYFGTWTRISGDDNHAIWQSTETFYRGSKIGIWEIGPVENPTCIYDKLGNMRMYTISEELAERDGMEYIGSIPTLTRTIANTATSDSVRIEKEWILSSSKATVTFPENTIVTKNDGGSFAFYQMTNQEATISDLTTDGLTGYTAGTIRFGIPGLNLSFSQPVTVALNVGSQYNGNTLTIKSLAEDQTSWANETTCKVSDGVCQFTTNHASYFAARSKKNMEGKLTLKVNLKKSTKKSSVRLTGKTGKYLDVTISVNGQTTHTLRAKKNGKFSARISLEAGANTVVVQATNSQGTRTVTKAVERR